MEQNMSDNFKIIEKDEIINNPKYKPIDLKENTAKYVRHNDIPTLYFHAKEDEFVPLKMVYPLYNKNRGEKVLFVLKDEKYLYELVENDDFKQTLSQFIKKYMK